MEAILKKYYFQFKLRILYNNSLLKILFWNYLKIQAM